MDGLGQNVDSRGGKDATSFLTTPTLSSISDSTGRKYEIAPAHHAVVAKEHVRGSDAPNGEEMAHSDTPDLIPFGGMCHDAGGRWKDYVLKLIFAQIDESIKRSKVCRLMLTGGRSASQLYTAWAASSKTPANIPGLHFFFGDERCVPPEHPESNYGLCCKSLFPGGIPDNVHVERIEGESADAEKAADRYAALLPDCVDILLLSVGEDGHIASLFAYGSAATKRGRRVVPVVAPIPPVRRITITSEVIHSARNVLVMAVGKEKRAILNEALRKPNDRDQLPARMVLDRHWILGE